MKRYLATAVLVLAAPGIGAAPGSIVGGSTTEAVTGSVRTPAAEGDLDAIVADDALRLRASFVSSTGWVKPGDSYPYRVLLDNLGDSDVTGVTITIPQAPSVTHTDAVALADVGVATIDGDGRVTWTIPTVTAGSLNTLVVEAEAATVSTDPRVVWKDLSATVTLTRDGADDLVARTHGPKVIPPAGNFESARYGDKPFPMVLVEYTDFKHQPENTAEKLDEVVNSPDFEGSMFNLYQEMSYGQLFPQGLVPTAGIEQAGWDYEPGFAFTNTEPGPCPATTFADVPGAIGSPAHPDRIVDGWYQLPGQLQYYGWDDPVFPYTLLAGVPSVYSIDSGCGDTGKSVYDAAQIADPEIDYNTFDSDKDGVVDFFMMMFAGCGGNGSSQLAFEPGILFDGDPCPYEDVPQDNIWPHSSSLEFGYVDEETGLRGYISDDQLKSLEEVPQCWTDTNHREFDDCAADGGTGLDDMPVFVRVGPYNVNPETAFDSASVISHEYGHHLGLPDFYNQGADYSAYGTFNLMASDYSQHMTVFGKQDMGWVVPQFLQPGDEVVVEDWAEVKSNTGQIVWQTPAGEMYTLSADNGDQFVNNGFAYGAKLPSRILIDPERLSSEASGEHAWYSGRGNEFGCSPTGGHNLDLYLPELEDVADGETVTLTFKSSWDIEWDWDYGFVLATADGDTYESLLSDAGFTTTSAFNPNNQGCLNELDNGITGTSGAYEQGEPFVTLARNPGEPSYADGAPFLVDSYDLSAYAGGAATVRFSYFTDAAFDRPGWFIDDVEVTVGDEVIYSSDLEDGEEHGRYVNGGCDEGLSTAVLCTDGWQYISSAEGNPADHGYYVEVRDRALFDFEGYDQSDRGELLWNPGLFVEYTDENHGYGNNGVSNHPAQHYLDSSPEQDPDTMGDCAASAGETCHDAAFVDAEGKTTFSDFDVWQDNFADPARESGRWEFDYGCLEVEVLSMSGEDTVQLEPDLTADARLTAGDGCSPFGYGTAGVIDIEPAPEPEPRPAPPAPEPDEAPMPATGGGVAAASLLALAAATAVRRRGRS